MNSCKIVPDTIHNQCCFCCHGSFNGSRNSSCQIWQPNPPLERRSIPSNLRSTASSLLFSPIASIPEVHRCPYKFIVRTCNITREYAEYGSEIMHRLYINGYNLGRPKVISLSFGMGHSMSNQHKKILTHTDLNENWFLHSVS